MILRLQRSDGRSEELLRLLRGCLGGCLGVRGGSWGAPEGSKGGGVVPLGTLGEVWVGPVGPILGFGSHPGFELKKGVGELFILRPLGEHFGSLLAPLGHYFLYLFRENAKVIFLTTLHAGSLVWQVEGPLFVVSCGIILSVVLWGGIL